MDFFTRDELHTLELALYHAPMGITQLHKSLGTFDDEESTERRKEIEAKMVRLWKMIMNELATRP